MSTHPESKWTHPICEGCWNERHPDRLATKIAEDIRDLERCCFCAAQTRSGIYVRHDPKKLELCPRGPAVELAEQEGLG